MWLRVATAFCVFGRGFAFVEFEVEFAAVVDVEVVVQDVVDCHRPCCSLAAQFPHNDSHGCSDRATRTCVHEITEDLASAINAKTPGHNMYYLIHWQLLGSVDVLLRFRHHVQIPPFDS